jgi:hypothetical protein
MRLKTLVLVSFGLLPAFGSAGDAETGVYMTGGGVGSVECPRFTATMERARSAGLGTSGYANEAYGFTMFIAGFRSAYNMQTPQTCDIFGGLTSDQLLVWADNYCKANPLEKFDAAVVALSKEVYLRRLRSCK